MAVLSPARFPTPGGWLARYWLVLFLCLPTTACKLRAQTAPSTEYQVKAAFLYNFSRFVEWPADAFPETQTPLTIGVLGDDPFGPYLDELVKGEKIDNRPVVIHRFQRVEEIKACHILFISKSEANRMEPILSSLKDRSILTVTEGDEPASHGEMISFFMAKNKIRFRINLEAAAKARLKISSKLIRVAETNPGKE